MTLNCEQKPIAQAMPGPIMVEGDQALRFSAGYRLLAIFLMLLLEIPTQGHKPLKLH